MAQLESYATGRNSSDVFGGIRQRAPHQVPKSLSGGVNLN